MPIKYCPHPGCGGATAYTFEAPVKCEKCKKMFASAFKINIVTEEKKEIVAKKKIKPTKRIASARVEEDVEEYDEDMDEDEFEALKEEIAASIDMADIKINVNRRGNRISLDDMIRNPEKYSDVGVRRQEEVDNTDYSKD